MAAPYALPINTALRGQQHDHGEVNSRRGRVAAPATHELLHIWLIRLWRSHLFPPALHLLLPANSARLPAYVGKVVVVDLDAIQNALQAITNVKAVQEWGCGSALLLTEQAQQPRRVSRMRGNCSTAMPSCLSRPGRWQVPPAGVHCKMGTCAVARQPLAAERFVRWSCSSVCS